MHLHHLPKSIVKIRNQAISIQLNPKFGFGVRHFASDC